MPAAAGRAFLRLHESKDAPKRSQRENKCHHSKHILVICHAGVYHFPGPNPVVPAKGWIILDKQKGNRQQDKTKAREEATKSSDRLLICYNYQNHQQVSACLEPSFERHARVIGPHNAKQTKKKIDQNGVVCVKQPQYLRPSMEQDN